MCAPSQQPDVVLPECMLARRCRHSARPSPLWVECVVVWRIESYSANNYTLNRWLWRPDTLEGMSSSTESGLPFKPVYDASDLADFDPAVELGEPGEFPFTEASTRRCTGTPVDDAPIRRIRQRRGVQRAVQAAHCRRNDWPSVALRPAHADGLRLLTTTGARRSRQGRSRD